MRLPGPYRDRSAGLLRLIAAALCAVTLGSGGAKAGASDEGADSLSSCAKAGPGFKKLPDSGVCIRLGIDSTLELHEDITRHDLAIETSRASDGSPGVAYEKVSRTTGRETLGGNLLLRPSVAAVAPTEYGPLTVFIRGGNIWYGDDRDRVVSSGPVFLDDAWVSLGGVTAGRRFSFFDYNTGFNYKPAYGSYRTTNLVAYTASLGSSVTGTLSLEDGFSRRTEDGVWANYGRSQTPDLVGALQVDRSWGNAHASVALHDIRPETWLPCACLPDGRALGVAGSAGLEYRQKFGDTYGRMVVAGAVAEGALDYLGIPRFAPDYIVDADGSIRKTKGFSALVSYEHVWRPNLRTSASFSVYGTNTHGSDLKWSSLGTLGQLGVEYMPIPNLIVGAEYSHYWDSVKAGGASSGAPRAAVPFDRVMMYVRHSFGT